MKILLTLIFFVIYFPSLAQSKLYACLEKKITSVYSKQEPREHKKSKAKILNFINDKKLKFGSYQYEKINNSFGLWKHKVTQNIIYINSSQKPLLVKEIEFVTYSGKFEEIKIIHYECSEN